MKLRGLGELPVTVQTVVERVIDAFLKERWVERKVRVGDRTRIESDQQRHVRTKPYQMQHVIASSPYLFLSFLISVSVIHTTHITSSHLPLMGALDANMYRHKLADKHSQKLFNLLS